VAINVQESQDKADAWRRKAGVPFAVVLDPEGATMHTYGVRSTPTVFLVDRDGNFLGGAIGTRPWTSRQGRAVIEKALKS
jgi:thioredoxin-related protein